MSQRRVIVTGATGLLGHYLVPELRGRDHEVVPLSLKTRGLTVRNIDLRDRAAVWRLLDEIEPAVIVHAAAMVNVDGCEEDYRAAFANNVETTRNLADWVQHRRARSSRIVYVSTDQVYRGEGPHAEADANPMNIYGLTKYWGEDVVSRTEEALILRVNFVGMGVFGRGGFGRWAVDSLFEEKPCVGFEDVVFTPLHAVDLSRVMADFIDLGRHGIYNVGAAGDGVSKAEFLISLGTALGMSVQNVTRGSVLDLALAAPRPNDMRMDVHKAEDALGYTLPTVNDTVRQLAAEAMDGRNATVHGGGS